MRSEPSVLSRVFSQPARPSLASRSFFSWQPPLGCGAPARQKKCPFLPVTGEQPSVLQVLESPEDTGTAATAGVGRRGCAGRRCHPRAAAPEAFTETGLRCGLGALLPLCCAAPTLAGGAGTPWGPGRGLERCHVTGTPGTEPRTTAYNGLSGAICSNSCNSLGRLS